MVHRSGWNASRLLGEDVTMATKREWRRRISDVCCVAGCERPFAAKDMCIKHYRRVCRTGTTHRPETPEERFWAKVEKGEGCWQWTATVVQEGYGSFKYEGRTLGAHRVAYRLTRGPIPMGMQLDHRCHTDDLSCPGGLACPHRRCVNPDHLEVVDNDENQRRKKARAQAQAQLISSFVKQ